MTMTAVQLAPNARDEIVEGLTQALAEVAVTTTKAQNFHWNVTGMAFDALHELFEDIYRNHFDEQDDLAERVRALDSHAEGRYSEFLKRSAVKEHDGHATDREMVEILKNDEETISATLRALAVLTERHGDVITNNIAADRAEKHEKFAWMLRAHLK